MLRKNVELTEPLWKNQKLPSYSILCSGLIKHSVSVLVSTGMQVLVLHLFSITVVLVHPQCEGNQHQEEFII